ncbi:MAG: cupin domain-containing protein [Clostridia bacterium]|nr:cupin domain-containing protein [Clostridia bacterium]
MNYVISGRGKAVCDGKAEILTAGCCHICPKGYAHSIMNTCAEDLVILTVVVKR